MGVSLPERVVAPTRDDSVARSASQVAGGPLGRYAVPLARGWRRIGAGLVALSAVPMGLGVWERGYCVEGGWRAPDQFFHMCFSDLPATFDNANLGAGLGALLAGGVEAPTPAHPPLTAMVLALTGGLVPSGSTEARARFFFGLWAMLIAIFIALTVWWTAAAVRRAPARAAQVALSPVVALVAVIAPDALGVALASAALYAWSRSRLVWSGVLFGLAISARTYPVVLLLAVALVAVRAGRARALVPVVGWALAVVAALAGLLAWHNPQGAMRSYAAWLDSSAGFGSPWVMGQLSGSPWPTWLVTALAVSGWVLAILVGIWMALGRERRPAVAEVALVMLAIVLVTGKSFPVQASLWLVPLVALVGLRWRDHLIWAGAEALHFGGVWLYLAGMSVADRGLPSGWYLLTLAVRVAGVLWLGMQTWWLATDRLPALFDPEEPDPLAGPLADAPDALVLRIA